MRLASPPTRVEKAQKLKIATNTAPGLDGIEYRDIIKLDPEGKLLEKLYGVVWRLGVPSSWKTARTVPIYKKGDSANFGNYLPISLLSTLHKVFSGTVATRLCTVARNNEWLSAEQKGFLPGVHGIQEHTMLLETAVGEARHRKDDLVICWLDLTNAFGSLPHDYLGALFWSLSIPRELQAILTDIYKDNFSQFVVGNATIPISMSTGVRQGDGLSSIVFNLAAEPLIRCAKGHLNGGYPLFGTVIKATAYADDISQVGQWPADLQAVVDAVSRVAAKLVLCFNGEKCASLTFTRGKVDSSRSIIIEGQPIRTLTAEENETYLGVPKGEKLLFRPATSLPENLTKILNSDLAPWLKLEVFRGHLLPSLAQHLATGRVEKSMLHTLHKECADFLRTLANVPFNVHRDFLYADRRAGGLGACKLSEDSDIWTIARAVQLLDSGVPVVREVARAQACKNISIALKTQPTTRQLSDYLSGSQQGGL